MGSQWSLVLFTILVQSAVGSVWCMHAALVLCGEKFGVFHLKFQLPAALFVMLTGLTAAMAHLGKPGTGIHAARNFRHSWLSREIIAVNLLAGILAVMVGLTCIRHGALIGWLMPVGSLAGGAVLYAMTRLYHLRTVPSWNNRGTPSRFLGSALLSGGVLFMLALNMATAVQNVAPDVSGADVSGNIAFVGALVGLVFKVWAAGVNPSGMTDKAAPLTTTQPALQGCGVALWAASILSGSGPGLQTALFYLAAISLAAGEIIHRSRFYKGYYRVGL
jgi:anaerobic dimethyl sulfoxide reductase subunit C (anchor subunit)